MNNTKPTKRPAAFSFAALDPYRQQTIVLPTERIITGSGIVEWGIHNAYPEYLLGLYNNTPTLHSIINGNIDYITGDDIAVQPLRTDYAPGVLNEAGHSVREQVRDVAKDFEIYGGFALQVIRNFLGAVVEVYYMDMRYLRTNKYADTFYYSEKWGKGSRSDTLVYPAYNPGLKWDELSEEEKTYNAASVLFIKNVHTQVYPAPLYAASVKACEIERQIDEFHLSDIQNHFVSSAIINFNNGDAPDEIKKEIEKDINEKFAGASNGGRIMLSWNPNKESATDIVEFKVADFGERYKALAEHSRAQIFTAFRAIPLLFGLTSEANTGFSTDEFEQSFKLYNRTQIRPVQRLICDAYEKIYGRPGVLTIRPFSLGGEVETYIN